MNYAKTGLKTIACRHCYKFDCNAIMKGRNIDEVIDATIKHGVSMHGLDLKKLHTEESRLDIGKTATELSA